MSNNSYYSIKEHILTQLQNKQKELEENDIPEAIENFRTLTSELGYEKVGKLVMGAKNLSELSNAEWFEMQRELETLFNVKIEKGFLIQGEEQQRRDNTWWSDNIKQQVETYYWSRYKEYISKFLPPSVVKVIDEDTDILMNNIGDPSFDRFSRYGMAVGHVQSGKTANYAALVCKAADAGYKVIIVIAGGINNLRNQTQVRMNESFVGEDRGKQIGAGVGNSRKEKLPISLTTAESDFNKADADRNSQGINFDNTRVPILLVIKKNTNTLDNVTTWIENISRNQVSKHAMLLIDDESDYASINTKKDDDEQTAINRKLRRLLSLFYKYNYVAYTATPYANIFIDHEAENEDLGRDLFPKDFIYAIDAPDNYFGARKIFLDTDYKHLIGISDYKDYLHEKHKKDLRLQDIPESMYDAVRLFIINVAVRFLRNDGDKHSSMLIHATRFTNIHEQISMIVGEYIEKARKEVGIYGGLPNAHNRSKIIKNLKHTHEFHYNGSLGFAWEDVLVGIRETVDSILVREVHQRTKIPLEYSKDRATNVIAIGGASLSRGFTLEGLCVSYFLRNTIFYDTLMQMARWFGYRKGYEDLCRIYMPDTRIGHFAHIIEATEDLIKDFKIMAERKRTPNDFGLAVRQDPDSALQITARNKQRHVTDFYLEINLDGKAKETSWLLDGVADREHNYEAIEQIVSRINQDKEAVIEKRNYIWKNVDKQHVIDFLSNFRVYGNEESLGISVRMPLKFILKYAEERGNWDVVLYSGTKDEISVGPCVIKKEKRQVTRRDGGYFEVNQRQISSGTAEAVTLDPHDREIVGSDRNETRKRLKRPLLMLHILHTNEDEQLAAFGVSFPNPDDNKGRNAKTIKVKMNTVGIQNLFGEDSLDEE